MDDAPKIKFEMPAESALSSGQGKNNTVAVIFFVVLCVVLVVALAVFVRGLPRDFSFASLDVSPPDTVGDVPGPIDVLPMYGGVVKNDVELASDSLFIDQVTKLVDRKTAAAGIVEGAWQFFQKGDDSTAMKRFNEAWLLDKENADIYKGYITLASENDSLDSLHAYAQKVVEQNPSLATVQCFLGAIDTNRRLKGQAFKKQYLDAAESEFKKGLAIDGKNPFCHLNFAAALFYNEKYQEAWDHIETNFNLPNDRFDENLILRIYDQVHSLNSADSYTIVATAYGRSGRNSEAFDIYQKGVVKYPNDVTMNCNLATAYVDKWYDDTYRNGYNLTEAERYFKKGLSLDKNSGLCHWSYAVMLSYQNKMEEAWKEIEKARASGWTHLDEDFVKRLQAIYPEPKK